MINHVRTLLLNRDGASRPDPSYFLEEFVDPNYKALNLPSFLQLVYRVLFGSGADDAYMNFRLRQYMLTLASTEFQAYVVALDPRITYLRKNSVVDEIDNASATALTPSAQGFSLFFVGQPASSLILPRLQYDWILKVITPTVVNIVDLRTNVTTNVVVTSDSGLTDLIPLSGQVDFFCRIATDVPLPAGAQWHITAFSNPQGDLSALIEPLSDLGDVVFSELFGDNEPFKTFGELFSKEIYLQYRLSGVLLAAAYRADEVRTNGQ